MPQTPVPQSAKSVVLFLLRYLSPNERTIPGHAKYGTSRIVSAVEALNGALKEIQVLADAWLYRQEQGIYVNAPVTTTGVFTAGSRTFTPLAGTWAAWMEGCTIVVAGSPDNQIMGYDPVSLDGTLRDPHTGATGTLATTVHHDSIQMDEIVSEVLYPVMWGADYELTEVGSAGEAARRWSGRDVSDYDYGVSRGGHQRTRHRALSAGTPAYVWVDNFWNDLNIQEKRMRLAPYPDVAERLLFNAKLEVPQFSVEDVIHNSNGPVWMTATSGTAATIPIPYVAAGNVRIFPAGDFGGDARAGDDYSMTSGNEVSSVIDITSKATNPTAGDKFLVWYEVAAAGTATAEGTLLRFPNNLVDTVLKKVAAQHFRQSPWFKNRTVIPEIERGYTEARKILANAKPQNKNHLSRTPRHG